MQQRTDFLVDTNFALYYLEGHPSVAEYEWYSFAVSVITELELLAKPELVPEEEAVIQQFLQKWPVLGLTAEINKLTVQLCRTYRLKSPDALIAATALHNSLPLVTADRQFSRVSELNLVLLEL